MARRILDLRDHPVIAIMVGFLVLAVVAVPTLLYFAEPSQGPAGDDSPRGTASSSAAPTPEGPGAVEGDLTISSAQPVQDVATRIVSQDDAFPGYRAALLTMAPQVDAQAARREGEQGGTLDDPEAAASAGWVEVYALRPESEADTQGQPDAQDQLGILVRSGEGGVRTRNVVGSDIERSRPQQVVAASYDAGRAVWWEVSGQDAGRLRFVLYAWSTDSGETTELFRTTPEDGQGPPGTPGFIGPVLRGDTVLWARVTTAGAGSPSRTDVMGCRVDDCEPQVVREDAGYPTAGPAGFAAIARDTESADDEVVSLVEIGPDLQVRGTPTPLPADVSTVSGFAGSTSGYVLLETPPNEPTRAVLLDDADDDAPRVVIGPPAGGFVNAVAGERLVAWGFAGSADEPVGGYAFDRGTGELVSLGDSSSRYGVAVAQGRVAYQLQSDRPNGLPDQRVALLR